YWHGVFGGLYLPHLRSAAYSNLIAAEAIVEGLRHRGRSWVEVEEVDFDLDGRPELLLSNAQLALGLVPHRGGHLFELDLRTGDVNADPPGIFFNLTNSLSRRREAYHRKISPAEAPQQEEPGEVKTIHEIAAVKTPRLHRKLRYDPYERESLVDHCLPTGVRLEALEELSYEELGDFVEGPYVVKDSPLTKNEARARLARQGTVRTDGEHALLVEKEVVLARRGTELTVAYRLHNLSGERLCFRFAVEWNFSLLAGDVPDRYYFLPLGQTQQKRGRDSFLPRRGAVRAVPAGKRIPSPFLAEQSRKAPDSAEEAADANIGPLASRRSLPSGDRLGLRDEWTGMELLLSAAGADGWFLFPIESVSQSEAGLELVYQSSCVMPHWVIDLPPGGQRRFSLALAIALLSTPVGLPPG
ncbi:MAG: DUF1926 domain-containing protein, partial [Planctomycetes bacterium]|nr:DUF1926 domain-containing protein [Planctomycetota bacterium]